MALPGTATTLGIVAEGVLTVAAAATPVALVTGATPCSLVHVAAPLDDNGVATNTKVVRVSKAGTSAVGYQITPTDGKGYNIRCRDASLLTVRVGLNGEKLNYMVLG